LPLLLAVVRAIRNAAEALFYPLSIIDGTGWCNMAGMEAGSVLMGVSY
jgi:hypothetical protein